MRAEHHLLFRVHRAGDFGDDVVDRYLFVVDVQVEVDGGGSGADPIAEVQPALPFLRGAWSVERGQQVAGLTVGDRGGGDPGQVLRVGGIESWGTGDRRCAGGERITGIPEEVLDAAALNAVGVTPGAVRIDRTTGEPVVGGTQRDGTPNRLHVITDALTG